MDPKHVNETLDRSEQKLWHRHVVEVRPGVLIMPMPFHKGHDGK